MKTQSMMCALMLTALPAAADLSVVFVEGAPKDRFTITNQGTCPLGQMTVQLDLSHSASGLIFDVTGQGAGVEVFQPLELVAGREFLERIPQVQDGDNSMTLPLTGLAVGAAISFTIDLDDTAGQSETMVSGSEMTGAKVVVQYNGGTQEAAFDQASSVVVPVMGCNA